jgi:dihydroorotase
MTTNYSRFDRPARAANLFLTGARVLDPRSGVDQILNLHIKDGLLHVGVKETPQDADVIPLNGHIITPGWFDLHVHFREPGKEVAETVDSGCQAAMNGGFTGVACMPNTNPPLDNAGVITWVRDLAKNFPVDVNIVSAATRERKGKELVDMAEIVDCGVRAFSDDGAPIRNTTVLRHALEYSNMLGARIFEHAEDIDLVCGGAMHEGEWSTRLGLPGMPSIAEDLDVLRCILVAEYTNTAVHICHVSTKGSVEWIRWARQKGLKVTAEVTPHHLLLIDEHCRDFDTNFKMNPPLRTDEDRKACLAGFIDGTLDAYATDHAPHSWEAKSVEFDQAPFGIIGLETALGLAMTHIVGKGLDLAALLERTVYAPRQILTLDIPAITTGNPANLTIIDPESVYKVDPSKFKSKSQNTPFGGWELKGRARGVVARGFALIKEN